MTTAPGKSRTNLTPSEEAPAFRVPTIEGAQPWLNLQNLPKRPEEFTFSLLSDRTGLARAGVFEQAVELTNLFRPDFTVHIGDAVEGYTDDPATISQQWEEFDGITDRLDGPLFRVSGNHDVSNPTMRDEWLRRFGALHYAFVYQECLFVVLDTQDPPQALEDFRFENVDIEKTHRTLLERFAADPQAAVAAQNTDTLEGPQPANFTEAQLAWIDEVMSQHTEVKWTFVFMHMPIWQDRTDQNYLRLREALGDRNFTMFSGHCHNYRREVIDGRDHIRLGPSGGIWCYEGDEGNFDHITLVTMTPNGPRIANVVLDGVIGVEGGEYRPRGRFDEPFEFDMAKQYLSES